MSDDEFESNTCPLCVEEMDLSDKNFLPCPCGYKVCMWCWHHIRENLNGLCPACRTPYNSDPHAFSAVDRQEVVKKNRERKQKEKQEKKVNDKPTLTKSQPVERKQLHNYRVVQRNLVNVLGLPFNLGNEETLRKPEYFGQYGKITKIVVLHKSPQSTQTTISAYVTFAFKEDASAAIQALDGYWLESHPLKVSFGTTKFCNNWIRSLPCNNPDCVYLHEMGDDDDRFTKEEIQAGNNKINIIPSGKDQIMVSGQGGPSGTGKRPSGEPILPAPVFYQDIPVPTASRPTGLLRSTSLSAPVPGQGILFDGMNKEATGGAPLAQSAGLSRKVGVSTVAERSVSLSSVALSSEKSEFTSMKDTKSAHGLSSKSKAVGLSPPVAVGKPTVELKHIRGGSKLQRESNFEPITQEDFDTEENNEKVKVHPQVAIPSVEEVKESILSFLATSPTSSDRKYGERLVPELDFNGMTDNAVFPVPISSLTISVWAGVGKAADTDLRFNPFGHILLSFSDLMNLTLPPVDATPSFVLAATSIKAVTTLDEVRRTTVSDSHSMMEGGHLQGAKQKQPNLSSTFQQAQFSLGLAPTHSAEHFQTRASSGASDSAAPNGLHTLKQLFPTVNLAYGSQKPAFPVNSSHGVQNGRQLRLENNSVLG